MKRGLFPAVSGKEVVLDLMEVGYYVRGRQSRHVHLRHVARRPLAIPDHKEIARGTLRAIIREAGLSVTEFTRLLRGEVEYSRRAAKRPRNF